MTTLLLDETLEEATAEEIEIGSFNHGYVQMRIGSLFEQTGKYTPISELTLDVRNIDLSQFDLRTKTEIKPDISLYPKRGLSRPQDILRMDEMPLLAVEIVSPKQGLYDLIEKTKVYFELGVQSCWLVEPTLSTITVYGSIDQQETFTKGEIRDPALVVTLTIEDIFA